MASFREILERHRESLQGQLRYRVVHSNALAIRKPYYVYEPPDLGDSGEVPLVFLFRGHEREFVNIDEDASRIRTSIEDVDKLIADGSLPPMILVMPGLNSSNNHIPSLGINMVGLAEQRPNGIGSGRFWDYLDRELIPRIEREYPQTAGGPRLAAGFSLGGYTVSLLATRRPGFLNEAGVYDGLFMWPQHLDKRQVTPAPFCDPIWSGASIFDAAFGKPRNRPAMSHWNPSDALVAASGVELDRLRTTRYWVSAAPADGGLGNRDRAKGFVSLLRKKRLQLGFTGTVFDADAAHTWHWADRFLVEFLTQAVANSVAATP